MAISGRRRRLPGRGSWRLPDGAQRHGLSTGAAPISIPPAEPSAARRWSVLSTLAVEPARRRWPSQTALTRGVMYLTLQIRALLRRGRGAGSAVYSIRPDGMAYAACPTSADPPWSPWKLLRLPACSVGLHLSPPRVVVVVSIAAVLLDRPHFRSRLRQPSPNFSSSHTRCCYP